MTESWAMVGMSVLQATIIAFGSGVSRGVITRVGWPEVGELTCHPLSTGFVQAKLSLLHPYL